jgi:hypothetical protein
MELVPSLEHALGECARVLKAGGHMLVHAIQTTDMLAPHDPTFIHLCRVQRLQAENMAQAAFEGSLEAVGLKIRARENVSGEWFEYGMEQGVLSSNLLLSYARLARARASFMHDFGQHAHDVALSWHTFLIYQLLGKLSTVIYTLQKI